MRKSVLGFNYIRRRILDLCFKKSMRMIDLENELKISRGSLRHHLNILEKEEKIEPMQRDKKLQGRPTYIQIKKEYLEDYNNKLRRQVELNRKILNLIKKRGELSKKEIMGECGGKVVTFLSTVGGFEDEGFIDIFYKLTLKGEKFLEDPKK